MAQTQRMTIWPASVREIAERRETPFRLLTKGAGPLARGAWWLLKKLNALEPYMETVRRWEYVPHKQDALHEAMLKAIDYDIEYIARGEAVFIIGGETFSELVDSPAFRDNMRFSTGPFMARDAYGGRRMYDIPIHVVSNMTGIAVVPRVLVEERRAPSPKDQAFQ